MDILLLAALITAGAYAFNAKAQNRRIALLASHLRNYQIEKLMETLTSGYLRGLGEADPERRAQIWSLLRTTEVTLRNQFNNFAAEFAKLGESETRVSRLPIGLPYADQLLPRATFDLRKAFLIHAQGIAALVGEGDQPTTRSKAFTLSAELFLMQHTCHWFCKSKTVASARTLARHKTPYAQLVDSVSPGTRKAYGELVG